MNLFEQQANEFANRHIGPNELETRQMLKVIGVRTLDELIDKTIPSSIRNRQHLEVTQPTSEFDYLAELQQVASKNKIFKNYIGQGYYDSITPSVIMRSLFENPGWYTQYTPYQAEISQGRLESLLNFQTVVSDLTALDIANASLLDEATAAAEAMTMCHSLKDGRNVFLVSENCHPQTIEVVRTRAHALGIEVLVGNHEEFEFGDKVFGALVQYPDTFGAIHDYAGMVDQAHK